jgi:hypothetical protein
MQSDFFKRKIISTFVFRTIGSQTLDFPFVVSIFGLEFRHIPCAFTDNTEAFWPLDRYSSQHNPQFSERAGGDAGPVCLYLDEGQQRLAALFVLPVMNLPLSRLGSSLPRVTELTLPQ